MMRLCSIIQRILMPPKCHGCAATITAENDSEAHIIPNALGGRLKPKGIICRTCNTKLDNVADNALIKAFGDWPTLLDIPRDRGSNPHKIIETKNGRRVRLEADGSMTAVDVKFDVTPVENGDTVQIAAGDMKTFRQLLKKAEKQFPQFDAKIAEQHARKVGIEDDDPLKMHLDFSPPVVFGGIVTAIWLYLIKMTGRAFMDWNHLLIVIQDMQTHGGKFRYMVNGLPGLKGPNIPLSHKIVVRSIPSSGKLIAYVEILGMLKVGGIFADAGGSTKELLEYIYVYDILNKRERSVEFSINSTEFEKQDWIKVGLGAADVKKLQKHFEDELEFVFVKVYHERFLGIQ